MNVQQVISEELEALKDTIIANMESAGAVASRRTINSMHVETDSMSGTLYGGLPDGAPMGTFETGRKAGKVPMGFTGIIRQWMDDKGIHAEPIPYLRPPVAPKYTPQERGDIKMASAIAHTIATRGTKLYKDGGRNNIYSDAIRETIARISSRLAGIMNLEIQNIKLN